MSDLRFRKKLIYNEIEKIKSEYKKNQEFIRLLNQQNNLLLNQAKRYHDEIELIGEELLKIETETLIKNNL